MFQTINIMKLLLGIFTTTLFISLISCTKSQKVPFKLPKNAISLITGESSKTWKLAWRYNNGTRMNMRGCFLSYRITYLSNLTFKDNNEEHDNCGASLKGSWEITKDQKENSYIKITSDLLPNLLNTDKDYKYFKILKLTKDTLKVQFRHKQFSSESTIIDTFVSEGLKVENRDFHW